jgi:hypothetical protein
VKPPRSSHGKISKTSAHQKKTKEEKLKLNESELGPVSLWIPSAFQPSPNDHYHRKSRIKVRLNEL